MAFSVTSLTIPALVKSVHEILSSYEGDYDFTSKHLSWSEKRANNEETYSKEFDNL